MSAPTGRMERRVRTASLAILAGLVLVTAGLLTRHPLAILVLSMTGTGLVILGNALYLIGLAVQRPGDEIKK